MKKKDVDLLNDQENETENIYVESMRRDRYYSAMVKDIVKNNRTSQRLKKIFFWVVCTVFLGICGLGAVVLILIAKKSDISIEDLGVAATGFGSILTSIIVLPQIIAKHLFPENSEEVRFAFIKDNQKNDQSNEYDGNAEEFTTNDAEEISDSNIDDEI